MKETHSIDMARVRELVDADPAAMRDLLETLLRQTGGQMAELEAAIQRVELGAVIRLAHSAGGGCGTCGVRPLAGLLRALEEAARGGRVEEVARWGREAAIEWARARAFVQDWLRESAADASAAQQL